MSYSFSAYFRIQLAILFGIYFGSIAVIIIICKFCEASMVKKVKENISLFINTFYTRKNVQTCPKYFICDRGCPELASYRVKLEKYPKLQNCLKLENVMVFTASTVIAACASLFILLLCVEIDDECRNDPNLDCFKKKPRFQNGLFYEPLPTNCSAISRADVVLCFRLDWPDFGRISLAIGTSYIAFKIMTNCLLYTTHCIVCIVDNCSCHCHRCCPDESLSEDFSEEHSTCCKGSCKAGSLPCLLITLIIIACVVLCYWAFLTFRYKPYSYQTENIPYIRIIQVGFAFIPFFILLTCVPWREFNGSKKYLAELSIPATRSGNTRSGNTRSGNTRSGNTRSSRARSCRTRSGNTRSSSARSSRSGSRNRISRSRNGRARSGKTRAAATNV